MQVANLESMAPLLLYGLGVGFPFLLCALPMCCWWCRSRAWSLRSCFCFKRLMRRAGIDKFDAFEALLLIHEAKHLNKSRATTCVRVTSGSHEVETDWNTHSIFQQPFLLFVEQGTEYIQLDLLDGYKRKMATLKLDPEKDILRCPVVQEKSFTMKAKQKGVGPATITLTIKLEKAGDEESGLAAGIGSRGKPQAVEVEYLLRDQLQKVGWQEQVPAGEQLDILARACTGPMQLFSSWGEPSPGILSILGPPQRRRWTLGIWKDSYELKNAHRGVTEVDLMRVTAVQADPGRSEVFSISYVDNNRVQDSLLMRRTDRSRDLWVELLTMMVSTVRENRQQRAAVHKALKAGREERVSQSASMVRASEGHHPGGGGAASSSGGGGRISERSARASRVASPGPRASSRSPSVSGTRIGRTTSAASTTSAVPERARSTSRSARGRSERAHH